MTDSKPPLKLVAMDAEDLAIVSACCQDGVLKVSDLEYLGRDKRFLLSLNRFVWEDADGKKSKKNFERRRTVLHFERVNRVQLMGVDRSQSDMVLSLLAITFSEGEAPGGVIELVFAGDGAIKLEVECIEAQMSDLSAAWEAKSQPTHAD
ncbi:MAG: DUF2948 family protein [Rhizobiaceae bacterium]|nr:DUF2948 family protein [Rhizobiaceae bacterium]MBL4732130.1 DUF2948 family protein [Rhizobiaceae bacterium]